MTIAVAYLATAIVFFGVDMVGLRLFVIPTFEAEAPGLLRKDPNIGAAAAFYLAYIAGLLWFVSLPALKADTGLAVVFFTGAALGALAYGTYEFTNLATLKGWTVKMVAIDLTWGAALTGTAAAAGVWITRATTS